MEQDRISYTENCVFCQIVAGKVQSSRVYEDEYTFAFMDQRQLNPGHVLAVPKRHIEMVYDLDDDTTARLSQTVVKVSRWVRSAFDCPGLNIWQSNGEIAGQEIFHVHFHILPRQKDDGCFNVYTHLPPVLSRVELDALADRIRKKIVSDPPEL